MQFNDKQLARPHKPYENTKANIEALTGLTGGEEAHASDTGENGYYDAVAATWVWGNGLTLPLAASLGGTGISNGASASLTLPNVALTLAAGGAYTLTIPATGTAALLGAANVFTALQKINVNSTLALLVEQDGVRDNVFIVNTTNGRVGINTVPSVTQHVAGSGLITLYEGTNTARFDIMDNASTSGARRFAFAVSSGQFNFSLRADDGTFSKAIMLLDNSGSVSIGTSAGAGKFNVIGDSNIVQAIFKNHSTQTVNNTEWQTSGGVAVAYITPLGGAVFNEGGDANADFRVEGDTNQNLIFTDASADAVLFGTGTQVAGAGVTLGLDVGITDAKNIILGTTTGTKIGTATTQKIGFWNAAPIVQPTTAVTAATFAANTSGIANDTATFDGYTIGQIVKALRNEGLLA